MTTGLREQFDKVFAQLQDDGLLMAWDSHLPSVTHIVAGEPVRGSWWSHKRAQAIFDVTEMLVDHPDVLMMKLISGKVTFVHRKLWNRIFSIGVGREDWQLRSLSPSARALLKALDEAGTIQAHKMKQEFGPRPGEVARELESQLLIHAEQIHTESGKHSKIIESWDAWAKRAGLRARATDPVAARRFIEQLLTKLNTKYHGLGRLPWPSTL